MNLNYNVNRTRWNSIKYVPALTSVRNENCNQILIDLFEKNGLGGNQKYPNLEKCYHTITSFFGIDPATVIFGFGADQLLKDVFMTLDYESIQIFEQSWWMATIYNQVFNKTILPNNFIFRDGRFMLRNRPEDVGGDVLYVINPHCPAGVELKTERLLDLASRFKYIVLDETYEHPLKIDKKLLQKDNIIIIKSFSKIGGAPGLRMGYCLAKKEIIDRMFVVKPLYEMNTEGVRYLDFIMNQNGVAILDESIEELQRCFDTLNEINGPGWSFKGGNFGMFEDRNKFKGRKYTVDSVPIVRVTLTDERNSHQLLI